MRTDSSLSRTYLTFRNNRYSSIHQISNDPDVLAGRRQRNVLLSSHKSDARKRRVGPLLSSSPGPVSSKILQLSSLPNTKQSRPTMSLSDDEDVTRPPESSDEENARDLVAKVSSDEETWPSRKRKLPAKQPLENRDVNTRNTRKSKRQKGSNEPLFASTVPEKLVESTEKDEDTFWQNMSQGSKPRGKFSQKSRSSQNSYAVPSSAPETEQDRAAFKPISREASPETDMSTSKMAKPGFREISGSPVTPQHTVKKQVSKLVGLSPAEPEPVVRVTFQAIERQDSDEEPTSRTNSNTSMSAIFEKAKRKRDRRGSSSSLSSLDSLVEYELDASQKAALMSDAKEIVDFANLPPHHVVCPCCRHPISLKNLPGYNLNIKPSALPLRSQTKFCHDHRIRDAEQIWQKRKYPAMNWDTFATSPSLKAHIATLIPIIRRKSPSYYLSTLDAAITAARGNQTEINRFFDITNIHHGYYGPRGARIISTAILEDADLQKILSRQLRNDKSMRIAGLGRLTDSVLLPEVLVRMVREDLKLDGSGKDVDVDVDSQARKVLKESVDLGLLLCADDDDVEVESDSNDDNDNDVAAARSFIELS